MYSELEIPFITPNTHTTPYADDTIQEISQTIKIKLTIFEGKVCLNQMRRLENEANFTSHNNSVCAAVSSPYESFIAPR